jgi:hypothetical protein
MDSSDKGTTIVLIGNFSDPMIMQNFPKSLIVVLFKNLILIVKNFFVLKYQTPNLLKQCWIVDTLKRAHKWKRTHASLYNDGYI